jgi:hypothetical protein
LFRPPADFWGGESIFSDSNRFLAAQIDFHGLEFFPKALKIESRLLKSI